MSDYKKKVDDLADDAARSASNLGDEAIRASSSDSHPALPDKPVRKTDEETHDSRLRHLVLTNFYLSSLRKVTDKVKMGRILMLLWQIGAHIKLYLEQDDPEWVEDYMLGEITSEEEIDEKLLQATTELDCMVPYYCDKAGRFVFIKGKKPIYADGSTVVPEFLEGDISTSSTSIMTRLGGELIYYADGRTRLFPPNVEKTWDIVTPPPQIEDDLKIILENWERWMRENVNDSVIVLSGNDSDFSAGDTLADDPPEIEINIEMEYWVWPPNGDLTQVWLHPDGDLVFINDEYNPQEDVFNTDGKPVTFDDDGEIVIDEGREDNQAIRFEVARLSDAAGNPGDEEIDPEAEERWEALRRNEKVKAGTTKYKESPANDLARTIADEVGSDGKPIRASMTFEDGEKVDIPPPEVPPEESFTATRAIKRIFGTDDSDEQTGDPPALSGSSTQVLPPSDSRFNFDPLDEEPLREIQKTRDLGTKKGLVPPPEEEDEDHNSDTTSTVEQGGSDPSESEGEDEARALTRTSMKFDTPQPKEATVSDPVPISVVRSTLQRDGDEVKTVPIPGEQPEDKNSSDLIGRKGEDVLGVCPKNPKFFLLQGEKEERREQMVLLRDPVTGGVPEDSSKFVFYMLPSDSALFQSQAPGSGEEEEDEDLELKNEDFLAARDFFGDEEDEEIEPLDGSGETAGALPSILANTNDQPFEGNSDEGLSQGGEDRTNNTSDGSEPEDTKHTKETDMTDPAPIPEPEPSPEPAPTPEINTIKVVKRDQDGTLTRDYEVDKNLVRSPHDKMDAATLNEEGTEFTFADGSDPGSRATLIDEESNIVEGVSLLAPSAPGTLHMLEAQANSGSESTDQPSRAKRAANWLWSEQDWKGRLTRTGLPALVIVLFVTWVCLPSKTEAPNQLANNTNQTAGTDKPMVKESVWLAAREFDKNYRQVRGDRHLSGTLDFRGTTGERFENVITNENVTEIVLLDYNTVEKQDWSPEIGGFPLPYDINSGFLSRISGSMGINHPVYFDRLGVAEFIVKTDVPHVGNNPAKLLRPVQLYVAPDTKVAPVYTVTLHPECQHRLNQVPANERDAVLRDILRVRASTWVRPQHIPSADGIQ